MKKYPFISIAILLLTAFVSISGSQAQSESPKPTMIEEKLRQLTMSDAEIKQAERDAKLKEMELLKSKVDKNLSDLQKYNYIFKDCIDTFYSCVEQSCDGKLENCVSAETGLKEDKISMASLQCYPDYRACSTVHLSQEMAKMENVDLYPILKRINGDAMQKMAVNSIFEKLATEYVRLMQISCESAGGFYYDGLCGVFVASVSDKEINFANDNFFQRVYKSKSDIALVLPGVALAKERGAIESSETETTTENTGIAWSFFTKQEYNQTEKRMSYSFSNDFYIIRKGAEDKETALNLGGFTFIPTGWDKVITDECFPTRVFENNEDGAAIDKALNVIKVNPLCAPDGYIRDKISNIMKENWSKIFKN